MIRDVSTQKNRINGLICEYAPKFNKNEVG